jgi:hypothetical protein
MAFELESEPEVACPLCTGHPEFEDHVVQAKANKSGKPYVHCDRTKCTINFRENGPEFLEPLADDDATALAQAAPSSEGDSGGATLADVLAGNAGENE